MVWPYRKKRTIFNQGAMLKLNQVFLLGLVVFTFQACVVTKEYERPSLAEQAATYRTDHLPQDSTSMATVSWKELFTDPMLQAYIDTALQNNMDIRTALRQIDIAEAYLRQARVAHFPSVIADARIGNQQLSRSRGGGSANQFELSAGVSWEADLWGKIRSEQRAAGASFLQTVAAHQAVKSRLVSGIASIYFQLLTMDEQMRVTRETIATRTKSLETTMLLKDAGSLTDVAVRQTEAQLLGARSILLDLETEVRLLENTLSILLGESPAERRRSRLDEQVVHVPLETGLPSDLLRNRPDVMAAEYDLIQAFEMTNVALASLYPTLSLNASGGLESGQIEKFFSAGSLFSSVIAGLTQPVFNRRALRTRHEVAQLQQEQAVIRFKKSLLNATREVSDALYLIDVATKKILLKEQESAAYHMAGEYSQELLNYGLANYLEVLTAQERALNSDLDIVHTRNSRLQAIVQLYEALGGGWR